jgi:hypothetical protein
MERRKQDCRDERDHNCDGYLQTRDLHIGFVAVNPDLVESRSRARQYKLPQEWQISVI